MHCPNCDQVSHCCCKSCLPRRKPDEVLEVWIDNELGLTACGHCGFAMIIDAWESMSMDLYHYKKDKEEVYAKYRSQGKMPDEKGYKPSFKAHWRMKLWRWRAIFKSIIKLSFGFGFIYKETRLETIKDEFRKL